MTNTSANDKSEKPFLSTHSAKAALDVASTLKYLQNPNTTGGQRLSKIISTIMSWGGEAASDTVNQ